MYSRALLVYLRALWVYSKALLEYSMTLLNTQQKAIFFSTKGLKKIYIYIYVHTHLQTDTDSPTDALSLSLAHTYIHSRAPSVHFEPLLVDCRALSAYLGLFWLIYFFLGCIL